LPCKHALHTLPLVMLLLAQSRHAPLLAICPGPHVMQLPWSGAAIVRAAQLTHVPFVDTCCAAQATQLVRSLLGCSPVPHTLHTPLVPARPAPQLTHAVRCALGLLPLAHCWHVPPTPADVLPHATHARWPGSGAVPLPHTAHAPFTVTLVAEQPSQPVPCALTVCVGPHGRHVTRSAFGTDPAGHGTHAVRSSDGTWLALHAEHSPRIPACPAAHATQPPRVAVDVVPCGQTWQMPLPLLNCPASHGTHVVRVGDGCLPMSHTVHCPPVPAIPAGHVTHAVLPWLLVRPSPHGLQTCSTPLLAVPGGQAAHA
jgi:hypothetical protein